MTMQKITFIGGGNMTTAMVLGLLNAEVPADSITVTNRGVEKLSAFQQLGVRTTQHNQQGVEDASVIILAVKPHQIADVCQEIKAAVPADAIVVSVAAGVPASFIGEKLGALLPVITAMPNTASQVNAGVTGLFANEAASDDDLDIVEALFSVLGLVVWLEEESALAAITATSGSGIAYYYRLMEYMQSEASVMGLPEEVLGVLVAQTMLGAAKMAIESDTPIADLRRQVTSPNGTTAAGVTAMDHANMAAGMQAAMQAAFKRFQEVTEGLCH